MKFKMSRRTRRQIAAALRANGDFSMLDARMTADPDGEAEWFFAGYPLEIDDSLPTDDIRVVL